MTGDVNIQVAKAYIGSFFIVGILMTLMTSI